MTVLFRLSLMFVFSMVVLGSEAFVLYQETYADAEECLVVDQKTSEGMDRLNQFLLLYQDSIMKKYPGSDITLLEFQTKLDNTINCNYGPKFSNYADYRNGFMNFLKDLVAIKNGKSLDFVGDKEAEQAILVLQKHFVKLVAAGYDITKPMNIKEDVNLNVSVNIPEEDVKLNGNLTVGSDGNYDMKNGKFDSTIDLSGSANIQYKDVANWDDNWNPVYKDYDILAKIGMNFDLLAARDMFLKINKLDVSFDSNTMTAEEKLQYQTALTMYKGFVDTMKGKYINLTSGSFYDVVGSDMMGLNTVSNITTNLTTKPIMEFYKTGDVYYGRFNENLCGLYDAFDNSMGYYGDSYTQDSPCSEFIKGGNVETKNRGYLILTKNYNNYALGVTDKFTTDKLPSSNIVDYKNLVTWNDAQINKVNIPLGEDLTQGYVKYENGKIVSKYQDDTSKFALDSQLSDGYKKFMLNLEIKVPSYDDNGVEKIDLVIIDGVIDYRTSLNNIELTLNASVKQNAVEVAKIYLRDKQVIKYLDQLKIEAPLNAVSIQAIQQQIFGGVYEDY